MVVQGAEIVDQKVKIVLEAGDVWVLRRNDKWEEEILGLITLG